MTPVFFPHRTQNHQNPPKRRGEDGFPDDITLSGFYVEFQAVPSSTLTLDACRNKHGLHGETK